MEVVVLLVNAAEVSRAREVYRTLSDDALRRVLSYSPFEISLTADELFDRLAVGHADQQGAIVRRILREASLGS